MTIEVYKEPNYKPGGIVAIYSKNMLYPDKKPKDDKYLGNIFSAGFGFIDIYYKDNRFRQTWSRGSSTTGEADVTRLAKQPQAVYCKAILALKDYSYTNNTTYPGSLVELG